MVCRYVGAPRLQQPKHDLSQIGGIVAAGMRFGTEQDVKIVPRSVRSKAPALSIVKAPISARINRRLQLQTGQLHISK
jgi:hypothetical protein